MSYYLKIKDLTEKTEYTRISEFKEGIIQMKQNGFVYLIIRDNDKQWENAVCLSTGELEKREDLEKGYDDHKLGFKKIKGIVELKQVPEKYSEIERIIANKFGWDGVDDVMGEITEEGLI